MPRDGWLTCYEAAARIGVSHHTVYRLISRGELVGYRFGGIRRIRTTDLETYLASRSDELVAEPENRT